MSSFTIHNSPLGRMNSTGIGLAGIDGVWWRPSCAPFPLPHALAEELAEAAEAFFALTEAVMTLVGTADGRASGLDQLVRHKVPPAWQAWAMASPVHLLRPDFQLAPDPTHTYHLSATELEIAPSAQGFAHAMQVGYGLPTDLATAMVRWLDGRRLLIVATAEWSEFLFDQLAFCRAIAEAGGRAHLVLTQRLAELTAAIQAGQQWRPPLFGIPHQPAQWDVDIDGRLVRHHLADYWLATWPTPTELGEAAIFRFGYLQNFSPAELVHMADWARAGATFLNPLHFVLDSKVLLAAGALPAVQERLTAAQRTVLGRALPETHLLTAALRPQLVAEQGEWVLKYAGFDHGQASWGGRSVVLGWQQTAEGWAAALAHGLAVPWPVVAQRVVRSAELAIPYWDEAHQQQTLRGVSRLRAFALRGRDGATAVAGAHLTLSQAAQVSESTTAVQAPVVWEG